MEPVADVVGFAPAQGSLAVGEDTAAVADGQGGALGGVDDPGGPPHFQGWVGAPARVGGSRVMAARSCPVRSWVWLGSWVGGPGGPRPCVPALRGRRGRAGGSCWRVTSTRVTAPSQASRRHASGSSGPAQPTSPPTAMGVAQEAVQVHRHAQLRPDPTGLGQPAALQVAAGQLSQGISLRSLPLLCRWRRPGGPSAPGRPARSGRPRAPTAHPRRPCRQRSGPATTRGGHGGAPAPDRRHPGRPPGARGPGAAAADRVQPSTRLDQHRFSRRGTCRSGGGCRRPGPRRR